MFSEKIRCWSGRSGWREATPPAAGGQRTTCTHSCQVVTEVCGGTLRSLVHHGEPSVVVRTESLDVGFQSESDLNVWMGPLVGVRPKRTKVIAALGRMNVTLTLCGFVTALSSSRLCTQRCGNGRLFEHQSQLGRNKLEQNGSDACFPRYD